MDIVYLIKKTDKNEELKYSLRSLSNIPHNKVFIIGDLPDFINIETIFYIPTEKLETRYRSTTNNLVRACLCKELSDDFILMNDDFFILKQVSDPEVELNLDRGYLVDLVCYYHFIHKNLTNYDKLAEETLKDLKNLGFEHPKSFELHTPIIINKDKFLSILDKINTEALHCSKRSVYGNYFIKDSKTIEDVKVLSTHTFNPDIQGEQTLMSCSDSSYSKVKDFLQQKFPDKSIYEK